MQSSHLAVTGYMGRRIHLGVTGSVAAYKALSLLRRFLATGASVSVALTEAACQFVTPLSFEALGADPVHATLFSPEAANFAHLAPAQTSHVLAVVPATADILAKLACGLADDLLSCQALAFEGPLVVAPAMNPRLWRAKATQANWQTLLDRGIVGVLPECGDMILLDLFFTALNYIFR